MKRNEIIKEAREWINTPFHHQGRLKNVGCDCAGLVVGVAKAFNYAVNDVTNYAHNPDANVFKATVESHLDKIELSDIKKGDLLIFSFLSEPQHIAIVSEINPTYIIHSYSRARKVTEHLLDDNWKKLIRGSYRFREIED